MLITPLRLFLGIWSIAVCSYLLIYDLFIVVLFSISLFWIVSESFISRRVPVPVCNKSRLKYAAIIFSLLSLIELFLMGNLPFFAALGVGKYIRYTEYGIGGLHGLVNGLHVALAVGYYILWCDSKKRFHLLLVIFLLAWSVFLLSRQLSVSICFCLVLTRQVIVSGGVIRLRDFRYLAFILTLVLLIFAALGGLRGTDAQLFDILGYESMTFLDNSPTLQWVVLYLASPVNNLLNNLSFEGQFSQVFSPLVPSFLRSGFDIFVPELTMPIFNVSSGFYLYSSSIDLFGVVFYVCLLGVLSLSISVAGKTSGFALYLFVCHGAVFSFFADFVVSLPFLAFYFFSNILLVGRIRAR
jgi:hypothetical protein